MDDGRAAHAAGQRRPAHSEPRVTRYSESRATDAPARDPFLLLTFLLGTQKKSKAQQTKNISQPEEHDAPKH